MAFNNIYWEKYTGTVSEINLFPLLVILEVIQGPHWERNHINVSCLIKIYQVNIGNYISVVNSRQYVIINMIHLWIYSKLFEYFHVTIFSFFNAIFYFFHTTLFCITSIIFRKKAITWKSHVTQTTLIGFFSIQCRFLNDF